MAGAALVQTLAQDAQTSLRSAEQQVALSRSLATADEPSYPPEQVQGA
ncbi:hypothetical protein [Bordetella tumulicola]